MRAPSCLVTLARYSLVVYYNHADAAVVGMSFRVSRAQLMSLPLLAPIAHPEFSASERKLLNHYRDVRSSHALLWYMAVSDYLRRRWAYYVPRGEMGINVPSAFCSS